MHPKPISYLLRGGSIELLIIIIKNRSIVRRLARGKLHLYNNNSNILVCDLLVVFIILHHKFL